MTIDFTGGLSDDREFLFAKQPDDPEMRESVNVWIWDDGVEFGMPRVGVEAMARPVEHARRAGQHRARRRPRAQRVRGRQGRTTAPW